MKNIFFILTLQLLLLSAKSQSLTDSNLPIVIITTDNNPSTGNPYEIPDDPKVPGTMKIIFRPNNARNYVIDQNTPEFLNYNGRIGIELRGSSSQLLPKKPYGLTTLKSDNVSNNNVSILGMPKENDWVMNALDYDPSLIRNYLSYELSRNIGNYAARGVYCEVIVNGNYKGLYVFMEKLKIDENRINIVKMTTADNYNSMVTGGYVTKTDKTTSGEPVAWTMSSYVGGNAQFFHDSPKIDEITTQQSTYIYNQFMGLKNTMAAQNSSIITGYPSIIDIPTFVDFMLISEFSSNVDSYFYSTYFHKDRNGKLRTGPVWDFNLTFGNDIFQWGYDRSHTDVWQFDNNDNTGPKFWKDLYTNPTFKCYLAKRWLELSAPGQPLNYTVISSQIDQLTDQISEAAVREEARWKPLRDRVTEISNLRTWIQTRTAWLNTKLNNCVACSNISLPALVISKINYNPLGSGIVLSDSLEFIEITNNSNVTVDLTGIYLRELGVTYQFPANSVIQAYEKLFLVSSARAFELKYGIKPFGQFTRNLSNKSQKIVLADAFGNVIDLVEYTDSSPWAIEADGHGAFLELINIDSDNSLASSWMASDMILATEDSPKGNLIRIYPVPAKNYIMVSCNNLNVKAYEITNMTGRNVAVNYNSTSNTINIENLEPNVYIIKIFFDNGASTVKKIIKIRE